MVHNGEVDKHRLLLSILGEIIFAGRSKKRLGQRHGKRLSNCRS